MVKKLWVKLHVERLDLICLRKEHEMPAVVKSGLKNIEDAKNQKAKKTSKTKASEKKVKKPIKKYKTK